MKRSFLPKRFRDRLFIAFLAATLIPLLLCSAILLQIFRVQLSDDAQVEAQTYLDRALGSLDKLYAGFSAAGERLGSDPIITNALLTRQGSATQIYAALYDATVDVRQYARFDLYDSGGQWRYSTGRPPEASSLPTRWGLLHHAGAQGLTFAATSDALDTAQPQLQAAVALEDASGAKTGYLVVSVYASHLRALLEEEYGSQNDLILLSEFWRPVYCVQPSLAVNLAPQLREQLLTGGSLDGLSEDFIFSVAHHPATGLYVILRQPQVFTGDTLTLLYTVSATCALICIAVSVILSLTLSRQLSLPVRRLTAAMDLVSQDHLDVQVPSGDDELGHLAGQFNAMVEALKKNRKELLDNQKELNEAQIRMLQAQLNPHFLCNTLDTMKWISKINKVPQVASMSANLADVLRYSISAGQLVPLWQEEETILRYIEIQKVRLSGRFTFTSRIPPELSGCLVPKLMLQPIVENAILHGLDGAEEGAVTLEARRDGGRLVITVSDTGKGLPPDLVGPYSHQGKRSGHLGLFNVDTILRKYFGEAYGLTLANRPTGGASVTAVLPVCEEEGPAC